MQTTESDVLPSEEDVHGIEDEIWGLISQDILPNHVKILSRKDGTLEHIQIPLSDGRIWT
jgi:hypothetical protein